MTPGERGRGPRRAAAAVGVGAGAVVLTGLQLTGVATNGAVAPFGGVVRTLAGTTGHVLSPPAAAAALPAFGGCEQLRRWYVRSTLPEVGPWGLGGGPVPIAVPEAGRRQPLASVAGDPSPVDRPVGSSATGSNVQVAGVDEGDVAKTDGRIVVRVVGQELVVTDVTGAEAVERSRTRLPGTLLWRPELLLHDGVVTVVAAEGVEYARMGGAPVPAPLESPAPTTAPGRRPAPGRPPGFAPVPQPVSRTRILTVDVSGAQPRVTSDRTVDGSEVAARQYDDGIVRVVLSSGGPRLRFVRPGGGRTPAEAMAANRRLVRQAPVSAWLPEVRAGSGPARPLLRCADVRHPVRASGPGTLTVLTFGGGEATTLSTTAVTAAGDVVYSSADRLYIATTPVPPPGPPREPASQSPAGSSVHAFALDRSRTTYLASGTLPGTVEDRWSLDEYHGHLRAAVAMGTPWQPRDNAVVVLTRSGDRLVPVGRLDGLGRGEQIRAVRWLGAVAVVVTFRQTDPLYTLDLADPRHPRLAGTLRMRGYSGYLHPLGDGLLLGLGRDATATGADLGARAATFDVRDLGHVRRTGVLDLGATADLATLGDPRAFTYLPALRTAVLPVTEAGPAGAFTTRFVALHVGADGALSRTRTWTTSEVGGGSSDERALPLGGDRVALVDRGVRIVHVG